jgi:F-type H+-transporting ATPase subunit epsilon
MATFKFELVSPERILFSGDVVSVIVPSVEGEITVLAGHAPLVATLKAGIVFVQTTDSNGKAVLDQEILTAEMKYTGSHDDDEKKRLHDSLVQLREFKHVFEQRKAA